MVSEAHHVTLQTPDQILVTAKIAHTKPRHTDPVNECCEE